MKKKSCNNIVPHGAIQAIQLHLWQPPQQAKADASSYLQIQSVPITERIDPRETRYILVILPQNFRASGGQFTAEEAHEIAKATKGWDWQLDENNRLYCLQRLEALIDSIIKRSSHLGGAK